VTALVADGARATDGDAQPAIAEVRLLGSLRVRRSDGSWVAPDEFRTSKTRQLLRLLALEHPGRTPVATLIDVLWPSAPETRGRASLRTAASQIRGTLRANHVVRVGDALYLDAVAVDVSRFQRNARRANLALAAGDAAACLAAARVALDTYCGDLAADEPYLEPLLHAQRRLAGEQHELLLTAAEAALRLRRPRETLVLAELALDRDGTCERACRLVMRGFAALDERSMALRVYQRFRRHLAAELGVAPAGTTQALYLGLLADAVVPEGRTA
jgi:SARP family transcriptional regulator, regulator of embCAB operon